MDSPYPAEISFLCPACGHISGQAISSDTITCQQCNNDFKLSGHYCPECFEYSAGNRASCANCGEMLMRSCTQCGRENWSGRDQCRYCGQSLDFLSTVAARHSPDATADRLNAQREMAKTIRVIDEEASKSSMEEMRSAEEARRGSLMVQEERRRQRDGQLILAAAVVLVLFFVILVILSLIL